MIDRVLDIEAQTRLADSLEILRDVADKHAVAVAHRLDERERGALDLGGLHVDVGVREQLAHALAVDGA